ncbi:hypothetical protein LTR37_004041 [Vermiconidia calcicola]|uniref:Uncharacterized protein n=1 Tax=Vermiconidia calcicola TaxID=1690605 RepID=A0ACC3NPP3_9PEZI|nr:hypothetical protein LTR37_004041 [Vermiconidia calcicola]
MSYYNQGGPPPPGQQYPQSNSPYPPQGGYLPPQQGYNQGYNQQMNQGHYNQPPPQQQGYGGSPYPQQQGFAPPPGPPPGQYGAPPPGPPPGQYGAPPRPPPGQYGAPPGPPQGQYGAPPGPSQGQYGAPPGPPPGHHGVPPPGPPPGQYGAPPQGHPSSQYGAPAHTGPAAPPSPGYVQGQQANMDMSRAADDLRKAMKGFGTDEAALIKTLSSLDPLQINSVKTAYKTKHRRDLFDDIKGETSGYFREGLLAMVRGPLDQDCHVLNEAIKGLGTKESAMNDVLLSRSNADMNAIKQRYKHINHRSLESDVKGDLSLKTERLFDMVLSARRQEESAPVNPQQIDADVQELYRATEGRAGADQVAVCSVITTRSNGQLRAIGHAYQQKYHRSLEQVFKKEFSGHMEDALVFMLRHAEDPAKHDADLLEECMKGAGTKDQALVRRIIMIHWGRDRLHQCKAAYRHFYKRELKQSIQSETSGDYEKLMVASIGG